MPKLITASDLRDILRPGVRIAVPGGVGEPTGLIELLREAPEAAAGVTFYQFPLAGLNHFDYSSLGNTARICTPFMAPHLRAAEESGRLEFIPVSMRQMYDYFARAPQFDLCLLQLAPPDAGGTLKHGFSFDFIEAMIGNSKRLLAEINAQLRPPAGVPGIAMDEIDYAVETSHAIIEMPAPKIDETARAIGQHVADFIPDGACLQTGIGSIPAAVLAGLSEHSDLGMHSGLIDDAGMELVQRGNLTGRRKAIDRGQHVACMAIGSQSLYDWAADNRQVVLRGANYTHEARIIAELDDFYSINSAIEIDLSGQVNAEWVGGRQVSGTGGSVDFMRAATFSRGGRSIIALASTAKGGARSRIVRKFAEGTPVTALRTDVDTIITEHGVAELKGQSLQARRERLIAIAAPQFRDQLQEDSRATSSAPT